MVDVCVSFCGVCLSVCVCVVCVFYDVIDCLWVLCDVEMLWCGV